MYGLYNYMSPDSFSKRTIEVIRNYTSLTTMGNVAVTSQQILQDQYDNAWFF